MSIADKRSSRLSKQLPMETILQVILKRIRWIIGVCTIVAVGSAILALMMPSIFNSSVLFLASNPHLMDRESLFREEGGRNPVYLFGGRDEMERMIAVGYSKQMFEYLTEKYDLYTHYDIDTVDEQSRFFLNEAISDHISLKKTPKNMLLLTVEDKDPFFASELANDFVRRLDEMYKIIILNKKQDYMNVYTKKLKERKQEVNTLKDSLINAIKMNPKDTVTAKVWNEVLDNALEQYNLVSNLYDQQKAAVEEDFSTIYILESAIPAVVKTGPIRWLIVFSATLVAFVAMILGVLIIDRLKTFKI
ncbi:MAG: hypothetical protein ACPGXL_04050 [Chitinophagales bacterium]